MVYENTVEKINSEWCWKRNAGENKSGALVKHGESGAKMYWNWRTCGNMMENAWKMAGTCWEDGVETRKTCGKIGAHQGRKLQRKSGTSVIPGQSATILTQSSIFMAVNVGFSGTFYCQRSNRLVATANRTWRWSNAMPGETHRKQK